MRDRKTARKPNRRGIVALYVLIVLIAVIGVLSLNESGDRSDRAGRERTGGAGGGPFRIVIDAGHGGIDPGAEGASGAEEKTMVLSVALKVGELLRQDPMFEVFMTREDDSFLELEDRADYSNDVQADAFLSIHGNQYDDPTISGVETYYDSEDSLLLAQAIHGKLVPATGFEDRGVKREEWTVLALNERPSILIELGFLSNPTEEASMIDPRWQNDAARAIADGLKQYFG
ncbi:N-acetylmuramoyl-L-alanine amidase family protein [Cohnella thailandensis]|uniref:N-acetylmuramoyl-L-alanine amidase n=1 Tax=Cohnella thailandensis TaxID=557557 RepID=A0A841SJI1_9BACL|nr:N-acetylmuramoyl-L-alanine amidase [Cohnella thailandensis]MBB6632673.1 N-acetylmuramoyl-L-alanine amidase [Cohnella thailandensis]MBP1975637.1 N-acetylmuramoyl-L-alanine amidase [Cohnella thailandensis]